MTSLDARGASNLYLTAGSLLHAYRYPEAHQPNGPVITPASFLDGGVNTLYVVAADHDQRLLSPLIVALISSILHAVALRSRERGPLHPTLRVLLDEAANIAPLRELPRQLSQAAGHGVRIATIWQSLGQLRAHYANNANAILANSTAKLFMGPVTDESTRDYITALLGDERVTETTTATDATTGLPTTRNVNHRSSARADPAALQQLAGDRAPLFNGDNLPAVVRLRPWWSTRR